MTLPRVASARPFGLAPAIVTVMSEV